MGPKEAGGEKEGGGGGGYNISHKKSEQKTTALYIYIPRSTKPAAAVVGVLPLVAGKVLVSAHLVEEYGI